MNNKEISFGKCRRISKSKSVFYYGIDYYNMIKNDIVDAMHRKAYIHLRKNGSYLCNYFAINDILNINKNNKIVYINPDMNSIEIVNIFEEFECARIHKKLNHKGIYFKAIIMKNHSFKDARQKYFYYKNI